MKNKIPMIICSLVVALLVVACVKHVVREQSVYKAEIDFFSAATGEAVEKGEAMLAEFCKCEDGQWSDLACAEMAETVVVLKARMGYHTDFMLYLGGLTVTGPSEDPPEIPEASSLCPVTPEAIPIRDGGVK